MQNQILVICLAVLSGVAFVFTSLVVFLISDDLYYTSLLSSATRPDESVWWALMCLACLNLVMCLVSIRQLTWLTNQRRPAYSPSFIADSTTDIKEVYTYNNPDLDKIAFSWQTRQDNYEGCTEEMTLAVNEAPAGYNVELDALIGLPPFSASATSPSKQSQADGYYYQGTNTDDTSLSRDSDPTVTSEELSLAELRKNARRDEFCAKLRTVVQTEYADMDLSPRTVAEKFHTSKSNFERNVRSYYDDSFMQILKKYRLHQAAKLLVEGRSITDVAYSVGFSSSNYFSSCFRHHFDITPTQYQKAYSTSGNTHHALPSMVEWLTLHH